MASQAPFIPQGTVFKMKHGRNGYIVCDSFIRHDKLCVRGRRRHDAKTETFPFIDIEVIDRPSLSNLAALARLDQQVAMKAADPFIAYWAGSASASVMAHQRRGAVETVSAGGAAR